MNPDTTLVQFLISEFGCVELPYPQNEPPIEVRFQRVVDDGPIDPMAGSKVPVENYDQSYLGFTSPISVEILLVRMKKFHEDLGYTIVETATFAECCVLRLKFEEQISIVVASVCKDQTKLILVSTI